MLLHRLNSSSKPEIVETTENEDEKASNINGLIDSAIERNDYQNVAVIGSGPVNIEVQKTLRTNNLNVASGTMLNMDS